MPWPLRITSDDNPRIKQILHLRKNRDRREAGLFIAEGNRDIERALAAGLIVKEFFFAPEIGPIPADLIARVSRTVPGPGLFQLPAKLFRKIAYLEKPEGLLALFEQPVHTLESLSAGDLFLIATGIEKPGNLGAMARTAAAAGCAGMLIADENVDAFNPNAIRASTGAVFSLPTVSVSSEQAIAFCQQRKIQIVSAVVHAEKDYTEVDLSLSTAIVIGAEDKGLPEIWRKAGIGVRIPMASGVVDSLNASTCAAVLLFETVRQRDAHSRVR